MAVDNELTADVKTIQGGKIVFASEVIATIAGLAANEIKGVAGMSGGVVEGITEMLGKKNLSKGVKVEVGTEEAAIDVSVIIEYGFRIHDVCAQAQQAIKNAVETMTGLKVVEVNVYVQSVSFDKVDTKLDKPKKDKEPKAIDPPRVR